MRTISRFFRIQFQLSANLRGRKMKGLLALFRRGGLDAIDEPRLEDFAAIGNGGGHDGHLQGRDPQLALPDAQIGRVARHPACPVTLDLSVGSGK